ncbi:M48 family metalloprotease [Nocardia bovistercoris]|uniref:M48 family metalloprotease n=1 Tax=Nocardia bovistercoris TaxID=2785916 RepID=A0A931IBK1_9NOCA|nr:M48 family metalloprotease [Nocardia bovistercoris]MBH0777493.1 M48 family metalloprotease [Nocardia bovistercoris]
MARPMHMDSSAGPHPPRRPARIRTTLVTLLVSLPSMVLGGLLVFAVGALFGSTPALGLTVFWLVAALFVPGPTGDMAPRIFPVRRPRPEEQGALGSAWHNVTRAAGVRAVDYSLWVEDTDHLNALAAPGRIVAITSVALRLGARELEAILAHELGHHLGGDQRARMLSYWYALPLTLLRRILRRIAWRFAVFVAHAAHVVGAVGALRLFGVRKPLDTIAIVVAVATRVGFVLALAVAAVLHFGALVALPLAAILLEPFAERAQRRRGELDADRTAVDLGYGAEMRAVLELWSQRAEPRGRFARLLDSHPEIATRIEAVEARMRDIHTPPPGGPRSAHPPRFASARRFIDGRTGERSRRRDR